MDNLETSPVEAPDPVATLEPDADPPSPDAAEDTAAQEPQGQPDGEPAGESAGVAVALENAEPGDELSTAAAEGSLSAGEGGAAVDGEADAPRGDKVEVIIGKIPDEHDLSLMHWTARCTCEEHDLLGRFGSRDEAEQKRQEHLDAQH